jgi:uncharacterized membrane protein YuzA (DUF378 family)
MKPQHGLRWFLAMLATWGLAACVVLGYLGRATLERIIWSLVGIAALWVVSSGVIAPFLHYLAACRTHPRERVGRSQPVTPKPAPRPVAHHVQRAPARAGRETV